MTNAEFEHRCIVENLVTKAWQLPSRPDLLKDCIDFVADKHETTDGHDYITHLIIEFLSSHCSQAVSSQDLDYMAKEKANEKS